jgi:hypothetical protein
MPSTDEIAVMPLLEVLAAAPNAEIEEGYLEPAALLVYARGALGSGTDLVLTADETGFRSDQIIDALVAASNRGFVERVATAWRLTERGRWALRQRRLTPSAEARAVVAAALAEAPSEAAATASTLLSSGSEMIAGGEQPVRVHGA